MLSVHGCRVLDHHQCFISKALAVKVLVERKQQFDISNVKKMLAEEQAHSNSFDWGVIELFQLKVKLTPFCLSYIFSSYN